MILCVHRRTNRAAQLGSIGVARCFAALALGLGTGACRSAIGLRDVDRMNRSVKARTVMLEPHLSLYSPYRVIPTRDFLELVVEEEARVAAWFELERIEDLVVWLEPTPGLRPEIVIDGNSARVEPARTPPPHVLGYAGGPVVIIRVQPPSFHVRADGQTIEGSWAPSGYRETVRHELAHAATSAAGIRGDPWLLEGLAHLLEFAKVDGNELRIDWRSPKLLSVAGLPRERRDLRRVLDYREDARRLLAGEHVGESDTRLVAASFVAFLLERDPGESSRDRLLAIMGLSRAELLALEPEWQASLAAATSGI
jgi:hypothetical protein